MAQAAWQTYKYDFLLVGPVKKFGDENVLRYEVAKFCADSEFVLGLFLPSVLRVGQKILGFDFFSLDWPVQQRVLGLIIFFRLFGSSAFWGNLIA